MTLVLVVAVALSLSQADPIEDLGSPDLDVREAAASALLWKRYEAVPQLLDALAHSDLEVRSRAKELLIRIGPRRWIGKYLRHPWGLQFFHHTHRDHLNLQGVTFLASVLETPHGYDFNLDSRSDTAAGTGFVVFRAGALSRVDPGHLGFKGGVVTWKIPGQRPLAVELNEGAVLVAYEGELPNQPLCTLLWERVLEDPQDPQAACLLADVLDPELAPVLRSWLAGDDAWARAAVAILSNHWAKYGKFDPSPDYFRHLQPALESARWGLAAPVAVLAAKHPEAFVPILKAGFASRNRWFQYLSLGVARVTGRGDLYDPAIEGFLASPMPDLQRESVFASLAVTPKESLPAKKIVDAALGYSYPSMFHEAFRSRKDVRLGVELAKNMEKSIDLVLLVMDVYADSDEVVDAFCAALPQEINEYYSHRAIDLLKGFAEGNKRAKPRSALAGFLRNPEAVIADRALRYLVDVARREALPEIRALLSSCEREHRRRGIEGLYAIWLLEKDQSESCAEVIRLMDLAQGEQETAEDLRSLAAIYAGAMKGESEAVSPDVRPYERLRAFG